MIDPRTVIDLTRNHFIHPAGDLCGIGTWVWNADQDDYEPCLVIVPRYRREGFTPCVVALSALWQYNPEHNGPAYLAKVSKLFVKALGFEDNMRNAFNVAEVIQNNISDLIKMPPNPVRAIVGADAVVTINGQKRTIELLDYQNVPQG